MLMKLTALIIDIVAVSIACIFTQIDDLYAIGYRMAQKSCHQVIWRNCIKYWLI